MIESLKIEGENSKRIWNHHSSHIHHKAPQSWEKIQYLSLSSGLEMILDTKIEKLLEREQEKLENSMRIFKRIDR